MKRNADSNNTFSIFSILDNLSRKISWPLKVLNVHVWLHTLW